MHEEALLKDLRRKLEELGRRESVDRITGVRLWVGALAHVPEETLRRRWAETVRGTVAEGSRLEVETSDDLADPRAAGIVLLQIDVDDPSTDAAGAPAAGELMKETRGTGR